MASDALTGLVLAGGRARRMQSAEKGLLPLGGEPLVAHACRFLAPHTRQVVISANRHLDRYAAYGVVVPDDPALGTDVGPLAGVASALALADTEWLLCLPVDVVNPAPNLADRLVDAVRRTGRPAAFVRSSRDHPLCALLHGELGNDLRSFLSSGGRRVRTWLARHDAVPLRFEPDPTQFFNINTPEDLCEAEQMLARASYASPP